MQKPWFRQSKLEEELCDLENDPYELNDLAGDSTYHDKLIELRAALAAWMQAINDEGLIPEWKWVEMTWPDMVQPVTARPECAVTANKVQLCLDNSLANSGK